MAVPPSLPPARPPASFKPHASNLPRSNSQPAKTEVVVWISRNQSEIVANCDHHSPSRVQVKHSGGGRRLPQQMLLRRRLFGLTYSSGTHYGAQSARRRGNSMGDAVGPSRIKGEKSRGKSPGSEKTSEVTQSGEWGGSVGRFKRSMEVPTLALMIVH